MYGEHSEDGKEVNNRPDSDMWKVEDLTLCARQAVTKKDLGTSRVYDQLELKV